MLQLKMLLQKLKVQNTLAFYALFSIGEISLVVIGILLALQFDNWDKEQDYREIEQHYYRDMVSQLEDDRQTLLGQIEYSDVFRKQYSMAIDIIAEDDKSKKGELAKYALNLKNYSSFRRKSSIYQTLISSGDIKHIRDKKVIARLHNLESEYDYIQRVEKIHRDIILDNIFPYYLIKAIRIADLSLESPDILYNYEFQNIIILTIGLMDEKTDIYKRAIEEIDKIKVLIETGRHDI
jgi:hypothetical protein